MLLRTRNEVISLLLLILVLWKQGQADDCSLSISETSLGDDPRHGFSSEVLADVYRCIDDSSVLPPLIVFAPGSISKAKYSFVSTRLAQKGYVVMVLDHPVRFFPWNAPLNFVTPIDFSNAISYAEKQTDFAVDLENIILLGHSYGSTRILLATNEQCNFPFCVRRVGHIPFPTIRGIKVPLHPNVKVALGYGVSTATPGGSVFSRLSNANGFPFFVLNGAGDAVTFRTTIRGEEEGQGTYDRLLPTKIMAILENFDHFSIVDDREEGIAEEDILSTLPRREQIEIVADALTFYIDKALAQNIDNNFCVQLTQRGNEANPTYNIEDCQEEYR
jgi:hypothetical protein